jgi:hypothetical protein
MKVLLITPVQNSILIGVQTCERGNAETEQILLFLACIGLGQTDVRECLLRGYE